MLMCRCAFAEKVYLKADLTRRLPAPQIEDRNLTTVSVCRVFESESGFICAARGLINDTRSDGY